MSRNFTRGANRSNKLVKAKGFGNWSRGAAGPVSRIEPTKIVYTADAPNPDLEYLKYVRWAEKHGYKPKPIHKWRRDLERNAAKKSVLSPRVRAHRNKPYQPIA